VREQAEPDAPNWDLIQSQSINGAIINVFQRKRPRGDWKNIKLTGVVAESPIGFIKSIMNFEKRKQWESLFEDGVIVEGIETGEKPSALLLDEELGDKGVKEGDKGAKGVVQTGGGGLVNVAVPENVKQQQSTTTTKLARTTDDVYTFLQTVDMAGIPHGMAIAFLNDPERQHALAHLRKQMMLSNPQECMLCQTPFDDATDIRFCPCCAMVSCAGCVSKRVFEVVSRNVMSVCVHCYRESSRIFQPPQALQDDTTIDESLRGKWWRPEVLGILDYSNPSSAPSAASSILSPSATGGHGKASAASTIAAASRTNRESMNIPSIYNDQDVLINTTGLRPLIPGLLDDLTSGVTSPNAPSPVPSSSASKSSSISNRTDPSSVTIEGGELSEGEEIDDDELPITTGTADVSLASPPSPNAKAVSTSPPPPTPPASTSSLPPTATTPPSAPLATINPALAAKMARCKSCGLLISRDIEAIEQHQEECMKTNQSRRTASVSGFIRSSIASIAGSPGGNAANLVNDVNKTYTLSPESSNISVHHGNHKQFAGIPRNPEAAKKYATRIIYRTARPDLSSAAAAAAEAKSPTPTGSNPSAPREVCVLQDCFVDQDGTAYLYEISVRHSEIRGITDYITADVMLLLHIAKPIKGNKTASQICIINQIDSHAKSSTLFSLGGESNKNKDIAGLRKEDLVRELKMCADLPNLLSAGQEDYSDESNVSLDDFELLAVLGRGGFGKVMQVRHKTSNIIFAMKILKKSELRRRRQVRSFFFLLLSLFFTLVLLLVSFSLVCLSSLSCFLPNVVFLRWKEHKLKERF
jgi:hypothetical protein